LKAVTPSWAAGINWKVEKAHGTECTVDIVLSDRRAGIKKRQKGAVLALCPMKEGGGGAASGWGRANIKMDGRIHEYTLVRYD
jgi:hypothetical protein